MADIKLPSTPKRCLCGRIPVVAKGKGGWILACPAWKTCDHAPSGGRFPDLKEAVEGWNFIIDLLSKNRRQNDEN